MRRVARLAIHEDGDLLVADDEGHISKLKKDAMDTGTRPGPGQSVLTGPGCVELYSDFTILGSHFWVEPSIPDIQDAVSIVKLEREIYSKMACDFCLGSIRWLLNLGDP